jgi:hypothetical protein
MGVASTEDIVDSNSNSSSEWVASALSHLFFVVLVVVPEVPAYLLIDEQIQHGTQTRISPLATPFCRWLTVFWLDLGCFGDTTEDPVP